MRAKPETAEASLGVLGKERISRYFYRNSGYLFIAPALVLLCTVVLLPILYSLGMAFFRFDLFRMNQGNPFTP